MYDPGIILRNLMLPFKVTVKDIHCITNTGPVLTYLILLKLLQTIDITKFKHLLPNISPLYISVCVCIKGLKNLKKKKCENRKT